MNDDDLAPLVEDYFASGAAREDREATMTNFVRINEQHVVNLDNVTELFLTHSAGLGCSRTAIVINFVSDTPLTIYNDMPAYDALKAWMDKQPGLDYGAIDLAARTDALLDLIYHREA